MTPASKAPFATAPGNIRDELNLDLVMEFNLGGWGMRRLAIVTKDQWVSNYSRYKNN
jgi:hypothetical protein